MNVDDLNCPSDIRQLDDATLIRLRNDAHNLVTIYEDKCTFLDREFVIRKLEE